MGKKESKNDNESNETINVSFLSFVNWLQYPPIVGGMGPVMEGYGDGVVLKDERAGKH